MEFQDKIDIEGTKVMAAYQENSFEYEEVHIKEEMLSDSGEMLPVIISEKKRRKQNPNNTTQGPSAHILCGIRSSEENNNITEGKTVHCAANAADDPSHHRCEHCHESFDNIARLRRHERKHWMKSCPICNKTVQVDNLKFHIGRMHGSDEPSAENRPFQCAHCEKTFFYRNHLLVHEQMHQKTRCPVCGEAYRSSYLKSHMARKHPGDVALSKTMPEHRCSACKETFTSKTLLWTHQQKHKKEVCAICNKTFRHDSMKMHVATAHPEDLSIPDAPSYRCGECDRTFLYKKQLTKHQRCHKMEKCGICKKLFKKDYIKVHTVQEHVSQKTRKH